MIIFYITTGIFILATSINTYLIHLQKSCFLTRIWKENAFKFFCITTFIPWILFLVGECYLISSDLGNIIQYSFLLAIGLLLIILGILLIIRSVQVLGFKNYAGYRFFNKNSRDRLVHKDIFRYMQNPSYNGFILVFLGFGFMLNSFEQIVLAGLSFVLLNFIEAKVEK